ncbi:MAG: cyclase family protein [Deltaproteobacteria bacterium]|nr:MAG: cyclase family protein [Deltaproteobacteria bacterium]
MFAALALLSGGCAASPAAERGAPVELAASAIVDLTYPFDERTVYWPTGERFAHRADTVGVQPGGYYYEAYSFCAAEHGGTHLDAPIHFAEHGWTADAIPLERTIGPAIVVDVTQRAANERDYLVSVADLRAWEREHGPIPDGAIVLLRTGHAKYWPDPERYLGTAERGSAATAKLHFPGLDPEAARWLVKERSVHAVGLDTPSIDAGPSTRFEAHRILLGANIPVFENVAQLEKLPALGFTVVALPMKIGAGSGGPLRIVALVPGR